MPSCWFIVAPLIAITSCVAVNQPPATVDRESGEVAFELAGPGGAALVVPVSINGQGPFAFVFDTGATLTCVDAALASDLELRDAAGAVGFGGGVRGLSPMRIVAIDSIAVGAAKASDLTGCVVDLESIRAAGLDVRGLLGLNFIKAYRVTLDFERRIVQMQPHEGGRSSPSGIVK